MLSIICDLRLESSSPQIRFYGNYFIRCDHNGDGVYTDGDVAGGPNNDFDSCIGIPNGNINKKERMVVDEANMNNFETKALCYIWLDTLKKDIEKSNSMFPEFRLNVNFRKEVLEDGKTGNDNAADNVQRG